MTDQAHSSRPFEENPSIRQVFSAGGIIIREDGQVLLIRSQTDTYTSLPKGRLNVGETVEEAALREVLEETGYHAVIVVPLGETSYTVTKGKSYKKTITIFLMKLADETEIPVPEREEHENYINLWVPLREAITELTEPAAKEMIERAINLIENG
jgi:8-oxo-dGTP pyrophosphatase MutT (NUDIX family)